MHFPSSPRAKSIARIYFAPCSQYRRTDRPAAQLDDSRPLPSIPIHGWPLRLNRKLETLLSAAFRSSSGYQEGNDDNAPAGPIRGGVTPRSRLLAAPHMSKSMKRGTRIRGDPQRPLNTKSIRKGFNERDEVGLVTNEDYSPTYGAVPPNQPSMLQGPTRRDVHAC